VEVEGAGVAVGGKSGPGVAFAAGLAGGADGWSGVVDPHAAPTTATDANRTAAGPKLARRRARPVAITPRYAPRSRVDAPPGRDLWLTRRIAGC